MEISDIYVHDAQLHRVVEDIEADTLTMEVELPILERDEEQEPRLLVFDDVYNYGSVAEFAGRRTGTEAWGYPPQSGAS